MGTIFVAYGRAGYRETVLEFALERATASGEDVLVYHILESDEESTQAVRDEIERVVERTAPGVAVEIEINAPDGASDRTNISKQKRLADVLLETDREFEYIVMGNVDRGSVERLVLPSMTEAVIGTHEIPVLLVPV